MDEHALLGCIDWIAHGFEIVQSVYPSWILTGPESAAAFGLHGALFIGERHPVAADRDALGNPAPQLRHPPRATAAPRSPKATPATSSAVRSARCAS